MSDLHQKIFEGSVCSFNNRIALRVVGNVKGMSYHSGSDKSIKFLGSIDGAMPLSVSRAPGTLMISIADLRALITQVAFSPNRAMA